ncbi:hypothetical protein B0H11DRAFT_1936223 [Mycena galericulata]|nr:hypothetical protein B0H11DRAFT_1936223 [Mycena galericulata]
MALSAYRRGSEKLNIVLSSNHYHLKGKSHCDPQLWHQLLIVQQMPAYRKQRTRSHRYHPYPTPNAAHTRSTTAPADAGVNMHPPANAHAGANLHPTVAGMNVHVLIAVAAHAYAHFNLVGANVQAGVGHHAANAHAHVDFNVLNPASNAHAVQASVAATLNEAVAAQAHVNFNIGGANLNHASGATHADVSANPYA